MGYVTFVVDEADEIILTTSDKFNEMSQMVQELARVLYHGDDLHAAIDAAEELMKKYPSHSFDSDIDQV